jgi:hypothetical protein
MDNDATRAAPHRSADKPVAIEPLALQRDKNRSPFYLGRVGHDFAESGLFPFTDEVAAGCRQYFVCAPRHY